MTEIITACITAGLALLGTVITAGLALLGVVVSNKSTAKKTIEQFLISQAVTDTKLEELTREVQKHNGFAERIPVLEEQMKVANHRIQDLENKTN